MKSEYLIFNMVVALMPFAARLALVRMRLPRLVPAMLAICLSASVFIPLDILMATRFWSYNSQFITGIHWLGLPVEELMFFFSVPLACLCIWENVRADSRVKYGRYYASALSVGMPFAIYVITGKPYPAVMALLCAVLVGIDYCFNNSLASIKAYWLFVGILSLLTLVFNGYLTARPIVIYDATYISGLRIYTIPVEDFVFGWAMVTLAVGSYERIRTRIPPVKRSEVG